MKKIIGIILLVFVSLEGAIYKNSRRYTSQTLESHETVSKTSPEKQIEHQFFLNDRVTVVYRPHGAKGSSLESDRTLLQAMIKMMDAIQGTELQKSRELEECINNFLDAVFITKNVEEQAFYASLINDFLKS